MSQQTRVTFETAIKHQHADGTIHAHGGSDNRGLNKFLREVGQIKAGETRPDETLGDDQHSHTTMSFGGGKSDQGTGPIVASERDESCGCETETNFTCPLHRRASSATEPTVNGSPLGITDDDADLYEPALDRNDPEDVATMNAIREGSANDRKARGLCVMNITTRDGAHMWCSRRIVPSHHDMKTEFGIVAIDQDGYCRQHAVKTYGPVEVK